MDPVTQNPSPSSSGPPAARKRIKNPAFDISRLSDTTSYHLLMTFCLLLVLGIVVIMAYVFYERTHKPLPTYFAIFHTATSEKETLDISQPNLAPNLTIDALLQWSNATTGKNVDVRLRALRQPNLTTDALIHWAIEAATACYNFDFYNYQQSLEAIRIYFTPTGYDSFLQALRLSGTLRDIESKRLVVSGVLTNTPVILKEGALTGGSYAWKIQLPMLVTYQSASDKRKQNIVLTLMIAHVPTLESAKGVGIASFVELRSTV